MPNVFVLPVIRREDYEAFRHDVGASLPKTFEEWAGILNTEIAAARRDGKMVIETMVNYGDFVRYCLANGCRPDPQILLDFAKSQKPLGEA